jgi:hypothetical protein
LDSWLLAAGAIVLIAITLWIVWPARNTNVSKRDRDVEAQTPAMTESLPPQGDRFEDQYTSATADLSAAGVATAIQAEMAQEQASDASQPSQRGEPVPQTPQRSVEMRGVPVQNAPEDATRTVSRWPEADPRTEPIGLASRAENYLQPYASQGHDSHGLLRPRTIGLGAGALLALLSAVGGAFLYSRWQAERNKPINRIKRSPAGQMTVAVIEEVAEVVVRMLRAR